MALSDGEMTTGTLTFAVITMSASALGPMTISVRAARFACAARRHAPALVASAPTAFAQSKDELNRARLEFQEGVALAAANNCGAALLKFRSVARVKNTAQVSFNIAECEERMGRLASALGDYRLAANAAQNDAKSADIYAKVSERVTALEGRVPKIKVTRGKGADSATIELDGVELGSAQLGTEIPVDPGPHVVVGKIGDKQYAHEAVTLEEKQTKTIDVVMNAPVVKNETGAEPTTTPTEEPPPQKPRSRVPGIVIASAGAVSVGVGLLFFGLRGGTLSDHDAICGAGQTICPPSAATQGHSIADKGKTYTGLFEVFTGLGTVAVVTGIVLAATAGPKKADAPPPAAASLFTPKRQGVWISASAPESNNGGASLMGSF